MKLKQSEFLTGRKVKSSLLICGLIGLVTISGCGIGAKAYKSSFEDFNDAIRKTADSQMLSNLVRMRYMESPVFLQVSSISTNFTLSGNLGASATLPDGGSNSYGIDAGAGYSESPTITFSLPESRGYYGLLMAPLSSNQILQLIDAGFDSGAVLRTGIRGINGLKNVTIEYSTYPSAPQSYSDFLEALTLVEKLNTEGLVEFAPSSGFGLWSSPIGPVGKDPLSQALLVASIVYAKNAGGDLVENGKGMYELHTFSRRIALRFAPAAVNSPDAQRLKSLLQLDPEKNAYSMNDFELTGKEKGRAYIGQSPAALDPEAVWQEIGIRGRSMMEIMQISSNGVQIPEEEISKGNVFVVPSSVQDPPPFVIKSSTGEPSNATIRTKYRGNWFYIEDNDLKSREGFALLTAMFAVTAGTVPGATPILTLPVN